MLLVKQTYDSDIKQDVKCFHVVAQRAVSQELQSQGDPSAGLLDLPKLVASQGLQM